MPAIVAGVVKRPRGSVPQRKDTNFLTGIDVDSPVDLMKGPEVGSLD